MNSATVCWDDVLAVNRPRLIQYIYSRIRHPQDAEDLTQQILMKAYRLRESYDPAKSSPSTWVYTIARSAVVDYLRTRKSPTSLDAIEGADNLLRDGGDGPELSLLRSETQDALAAALTRMEEKERDLLILHYYEELPLTEIARLMSLSYSSIKRLHARSLAQLKLLMQAVV